MKKQGKINAPKWYLLLMAPASFVFWGFFHEQHLYQMEQVQLFLFSPDYFMQHLAVQGGISIYLGEFLTQFFGIPFAGAVIITCLLIILQRLTQKLLSQVSDIPVFLLLSAIPSLVYGVLLCNNFYYLSGLIGVILPVWAALFYVKIKNRNSRIGWALILIPFTYWITGGAYLILTSIILLKEFLSRLLPKEKQDTIPVRIWMLILLTGIFMPLLARRFLLPDTLLQSYLSHAYYRLVIFFPGALILLFVSFPLLFVLAWIIPKDFSVKNAVVQSVLFVLLTSGTALAISSTADFEQEREMAFDNLACHEKWEQIVRLAEKKPPSTPVSRLAANLALAKTGRLSSLLVLQVNPEGAESLYLPFKREGMSPILRNELYFQLGLINFSQMYAMESLESTPDGRYPVRAMKRVAETFIINGQYDVARKYLAYLSRTLFYGKWAKKELNKLNDEEKILSEWGEIRKRQPRDSFFHNDSQFDLSMLFLLKANPNNRLAFEYLMAYYLLNKNFDGFLQNLYRLKELDYHEMPILYQQALAYLYTRHVDLPVIRKEYPLSDQVTEQLRLYARAFVSGGQDRPVMKAQFGDTYWYYIHFK